MGQFKLAQPALPLEQTKIRERATQNCLNWTVIHWYAPKIGENIIIYYLDSVSQTWVIINKDEEYSKTDFCNLISLVYMNFMDYELDKILWGLSKLYTQIELGRPFGKENSGFTFWLIERKCLSVLFKVLIYT